MKSFLIIVPIAVISLANSCSKSTGILKEGSVEIKLHECKNGFISGDDLKLCFDAVISDSRCPANAICIWQGAATVKLSFTKNEQAHSFNLSSLTMPPTYNKDTVIAGYKFEFINLSPYPGTVSGPIPDNQRKAEIKITKQ